MVITTGLVFTEGSKNDRHIGMTLVAHCLDGSHDQDVYAQREFSGHALLCSAHAPGRS